MLPEFVKRLLLALLAAAVSSEEDASALAQAEIFMRRNNWA